MMSLLSPPNPRTSPNGFVQLHVEPVVSEGLGSPRYCLLQRTALVQPARACLQRCLAAKRFGSCTPGLKNSPAAERRRSMPETLPHSPIDSDLDMHRSIASAKVASCLAAHALAVCCNHHMAWLGLRARASRICGSELSVRSIRSRFERLLFSRLVGLKSRFVCLVSGPTGSDAEIPEVILSLLYSSSGRVFSG